MLADYHGHDRCNYKVHQTRLRCMIHLAQYHNIHRCEHYNNVQEVYTDHTYHRLLYEAGS